MAKIRRKILRNAVLSAPKPFVNLVMRAFGTSIFNMSTSIWRILTLQSMLLLAKKSKSYLQVGEYVPNASVQNYLITVIDVLANIMLSEVLRMRGRARANSY